MLSGKENEWLKKMSKKVEERALEARSLKPAPSGWGWDQPRFSR